METTNLNQLDEQAWQLPGEDETNDAADQSNYPEDDTLDDDNDLEDDDDLDDSDELDTDESDDDDVLSDDDDDLASDQSANDVDGNGGYPDDANELADNS